MGAGARTAKRGAHRGAHSAPAKGLGRLGFIAKGLLYGVVAVIALDVALGDRNKAQPEEGAIRPSPSSRSGRCCWSCSRSGLPDTCSGG